MWNVQFWFRIWSKTIKNGQNCQKYRKNSLKIIEIHQKCLKKTKNRWIKNVQFEIWVLDQIRPSLDLIESSSDDRWDKKITWSNIFFTKGNCCWKIKCWQSDVGDIVLRVTESWWQKWIKPSLLSKTCYWQMSSPTWM